MPDEEKEYSYTIGSYLNNPIGVGAATLPQRKAILETLQAKYYNLKKTSKFSTKVFKVGKSVLFLIKVPSETVDKLYYTVALEFLDADDNTSLLNKNINIFSNSPSFAYTYAYVFNDRKLLISYLSSRLPKQSLTDEPEIRNPDEIINYEKSIVYAILYFRENRFFERENFSSVIKVSNKVSIKNEIPDFDDLMADYNKKKKAQAALKAAEKKAASEIKAKAKALEKQKKVLTKPIKKPVTKTVRKK